MVCNCIASVNHYSLLQSRIDQLYSRQLAKMRRGGRGSNLQGPWRRLDDPAIASARYLKRGWTARNCVCVTVLAACSMAMSILIWSSRHQSSSSGMVFPLYHYYRSGGHRMGWRENRAARGRGILGTDVFTNIRGGHRINFDDIEQFYIEMKLGVPPVKYNFAVDTASGVSWVYCDIPTIVSEMTNWGPNGLFVPQDTSFVSCAGDTAALCRQLQDSSGGEEPCDSSVNYQCVFVARYGDDSIYMGLIVNESFTVAMEDKSERNLFGSFGCVIGKVRTGQETLPLLTDGLIGLGNCKGTLLDQWTTSKSVRQSVLGVCLAKGVDWTARPSPATPVGYISMGMDFKEKFGQSNSVWSKLNDPGEPISCSYAVNLLYISLAGVEKDFHSAVMFDTGSDLTFLVTSVYQPLLEALEVYASLLGFLSVADNRLYVAEEQRVCWQIPDLSLAKGSPIQEFPPIVFAFEGIDSASQRDTFQYLTVDPANYLIWDAIANKLCVTILEDDTYSISNIGADMLREHLFVYDIENQRVRWKSDNCELN